MSKRLTQSEVQSYLWGAANILRGLVAAGDYNQYIFPLLSSKRLSDVWDGEYDEAFADTGDADYAKIKIPKAMGAFLNVDTSRTYTMEEVMEIARGFAPPGFELSESMVAGFLGLGQMGTPIASFLLKAGYAVTGCDVVPERMAAPVGPRPRSVSAHEMRRDSM